MKIARFLFALAFALSFLSIRGEAQRTPATPAAASAPTAIPALVPYSGVAVAADGKPLTGEAGVTFLIFKEEQGGEPLWVESQTVAFDPAGHYRVQLGAANPNGLPSALFATGEARWLEAQVAGEKPQARVLLASVPYALKAADAATLGGLPPSAFALAGSQTSFALGGAAPAGVVSDATSNVTTTGGTSGYVPVFTGSSTVGNSKLYSSSTGVGIGDVPSSTALLDVNGRSIWRGVMTVVRTGNATTSTSYPSFPMVFQASAYNSSSKAMVLPTFQFQVEPAGNNTANTGATFNFLYTGNNGTPAETGMYFNDTGTIHFAAGQTFGGKSTSGIAIDGTSTSSTGVEGTSSTGSGVVGTTSAATASGAAGVIGINGNQDAGVGVFGRGSTLSDLGQTLNFYGAGVWGDSAILGQSVFAPGVVGTADDQRAGFFLNNSPDGFYTLEAINTTESNSEVAYFGNNSFAACTVDTQGDLACTGTKSAVVPVDNNTRKVALYAVEAPENWFEDFGTGQLSNGVATVTLEPTFAQTVNLGVDYHVFLTPKGDSKGLYLSRTTPTSFEVRESGGGHSTLAFDYRIVARRKGYETLRLADKTKERDPAQLPRIAHGVAAQRTASTRP